MRALTIARRELGAAFEAPTGWVVLAFFPAVAAAFFFVLGPFFALGEASLRGFFSNMPWLLAVVAPAIAMRGWAEERRAGTEELLLTWPLRLRDLVLGKFLGAWAVLALALTATLPVPITVAALGELDLGPVFGGYLGTLWSGGAALAVGHAFSACTRSQVVAWLASVAVLMTLNLIGLAATAPAMPEAIGRLLLTLDLQTHFHAIARGVADFGSMTHYAGLIAFALGCCGLVLEARAAAPRVTRAQAGLAAALLLVLIAGILALAGRARWRLDLTEDGIYGLDPATRGLLARLEDRLQVKFYFNRDVEGGEALLPQRLRLRDFLEEVEAAGAPWLRVETVDPTADLVAQRDAEHAGIEPLPIATGGVAETGVALAYQGLELRYQDRSEVIPFTTPAELEFAFSSRLSSLLQARRPVIAFFSREPALGPPVPGMPRRVPENRIYHELRATLAARCTVRDVDLTEPDWRREGVAALIVARPEQCTPAEVAALDRYLAEGGRILILADTEAVDVQDFAAVPISSGLEAWLAGLGLRVMPHLVWDDSCLVLNVGSEDVETQAGRQRVPLRAAYGFIPSLGGDSFAADQAVTAGLNGVTLFWSHPVQVQTLPPGIVSTTLLRSSANAWAAPPDTPIVLDRGVIERVGSFVRQGGPGSAQPLAVALRGQFPAQIEHADLAPAPGLLTVIGDSDLFHNYVLNDRSAGGGNAAFAANLGDWLTGDESLIGLRSRGRTDRSLRDFRAEYVAAQGGWAQTDEENRVLDREAQAHARARQRWLAWGNVLGAPLAILALAWLGRWRRRAADASVPAERIAGTAAGGGAP